MKTQFDVTRHGSRDYLPLFLAKDIECLSLIKIFQIWVGISQNGVLYISIHGGYFLDHNFNKNSIIGHYKGTDLAYDILCETVGSDNEDKAGDRLTGNSPINLKTLTSNKDNVLAKNVHRIRPHRRKNTRKISYLMQGLLSSTFPGQNKGIRKLHHDFNKKIQSQTIFTQNFFQYEFI